MLLLLVDSQELLMKSIDVWNLGVLPRLEMLLVELVSETFLP